MMLRSSFGLGKMADALERAVDHVLAEGWRTADIASPGTKKIGCVEMGRKVAEALAA